MVLISLAKRGYLRGRRAAECVGTPDEPHGNRRIAVRPGWLPARERHLFGEISGTKRMRLIDTQTVGDGLSLLTYEFARDA